MPAFRYVEPRQCETCGKEIERKRTPKGALTPASIYEKVRYCSKACANRRADPSPTLGAGRHRIRHFRGNSCETCGREDSLHIHHIDSNPLNNESENLKTLCITCHGKTRRKERPSCALCDEPTRGYSAYCSMHLMRLLRHGDPNITLRRNPRWSQRKTHSTLQSEPQSSIRQETLPGLAGK